MGKTGQKKANNKKKKPDTDAVFVEVVPENDNEKVVLKTTKKALQLCKVLNECHSTCSSDSTDVVQATVPVLRVSADVMKAVLRWCEKYSEIKTKQDALMEEKMELERGPRVGPMGAVLPTITTEDTVTAVMEDFNKQMFASQGMEVIMPLLEAAIYLGCKPLQGVTAQAVADILTGKTQFVEK